MKPGSVTRAIIGSFEDIGKSIVEETVKVPTQVVDTALESMGMSSAKKIGQSRSNAFQVAYGEGKPRDPNSPLEKIATSTDDQTKQIIARAALAQLSGRRQATEEPSIFEIKNREEKVTEDTTIEQIKKAQASILPKTGSKRPPGDFYGARAKQTATERKIKGAD